jgi:hypothetical protein
MTAKQAAQVAVLVIAIAALFLLLPHIKKAQAPTVTDFQSCIDAGGQILESDPIQCLSGGKTYRENESSDPEVVLDTPQYGGIVTSPLKISGKARNTWFFEANIPVVLKDQNGKVLIQKGLTATSDWTVPGFVPFSGTLEFTADTDYGVLIINKDNPSGDPARDSSFAVPVRFK